MECAERNHEDKWQRQALSNDVHILIVSLMSTLGRGNPTTKEEEEEEKEIMKRKNYPSNTRDISTYEHWSAQHHEQIEIRN